MGTFSINNAGPRILYLLGAALLVACFVVYLFLPAVYSVHFTNGARVSFTARAFVAEFGVLACQALFSYFIFRYRLWQVLPILIAAVLSLFLLIYNALLFNAVLGIASLLQTSLRGVRGADMKSLKVDSLWQLKIFFFVVMAWAAVMLSLMLYRLILRRARIKALAKLACADAQQS